MTFTNIPNTRKSKEYTEPSYQRFIDRPPLETKSRVAIVRGNNYSEAERMVKEALNLLGIKEICKKDDNVLIKPNMVIPTPPEIGETTHPAVVAAMVKICKKTGATVNVGDSCGWHLPMRMVMTITGVKKAALDAGADKVLDLGKGKRVEVEIPGARAIKTASIPKAVVDADIIINLPKMKNNFVTLTTLSIKNMLGLIPISDRHLYHRTPWDMAWAVNDLFKIIKDQHKLTLIDGIIGMEGATHIGFPCNPGVITASQDPIAVEAVTNMIMGYHPLESPHVQVGMKDGLGTGDLAEIDVVGARLQDVIYPFQRSMIRFVSEYTNITEYYGGTCNACLWVAVSVPPAVNPKKKYAVIAGTRALIANKLDDVDEVWLVGQCACTENHQFPGYMDKVKAAKKIVRIPTCSAMEYALEETMGEIGGVYDLARKSGLQDLYTMDALSLLQLRDTIRPGITDKAKDRKEGRIKNFQL